MSRNVNTLVMAIALSVAGIGSPKPLVQAQQAPAPSRSIKRKVMPDYPELAKRMNLTGKVKLRVVIAADGHVMLTRAVGGHPVLVQAAEDALKDWKFVPAATESSQYVEMEFAGTEVR